ncbi:two-component system, OmpR family, sensor histidine kinase MtrB [Austwickia chelonae]|uniref:Sensor histidine kinase MtrB n=1 Tax=Austwickia chelonae NBRC 105200 TaxID=1184607 RepID=K6V7Z2_9MICO|nr:putative two-component histidine kinase [Austwickia chelonae NBRC 105200]SEW01786.1 two-component system, OmpR family, sensor histidine kinase MtrB [Austwickia chelonae]
MVDAARRALHLTTEGARRCSSWVARQWRSSLQFRVVTATVVLCLVVMGLLQTYLYQRIADGLVQDRIVSTREEAAAGTREIQAKLATTDKLDSESLRQTAYDLIRQQESQRGESTRDLILTKARSNSSRDMNLPTLETGIDPKIVPDDIREAISKDPSRQQVKIVSIPRGEDRVSAVLIGAIVRIPEAGDYELYYVYPMDRQEQILNMVERTFLLGVVIFAVLVGLISHVVTRLVVDPVREAAVVAGRLANGRLNERLDIKGEDDLAKLAAAFNDMADTLQAQISRLEDLSAVQQRFVSDVSHELRTPLTTIRMAAEVIHDDRSAFPPVSSRSTEILYAEVERFGDLLADLLEISRFDAGAANLDRDNADIRDVVHRVLAGTAELAKHKGSSVLLVGADEPLRAEMDPRRVERIIRNLVSNALEHGEGRPLRVEIAGNDSAIAVAVRDFGIGLRPGEADLVFTRFWRADPSRKRTTGGTGLGLAIAMEDARLHDGWLQAWGEPGEGSRFRLTLPRVAGRPIGYSPLPLTDPKPQKSPDGQPIGEPILPAEETSSAVAAPGATVLGATVVAALGTEPDEIPADPSSEESAVAENAAAAVDPSAGSEPTDGAKPPTDEIDDLDRMPPPEELAEIEGLAELEAHARTMRQENPEVKE